jgi:hypothetical protein
MIWMKDEFIDAGCPVRIINGMPDHISLPVPS